MKLNLETIRPSTPVKWPPVHYRKQAYKSQRSPSLRCKLPRTVILSVVRLANTAMTWKEVREKCRNNSQNLAKSFSRLTCQSSRKIARKTINKTTEPIYPSCPHFASTKAAMRSVKNLSLTYMEIRHGTARTTTSTSDRRSSHRAEQTRRKVDVRECLSIGWSWSLPHFSLFSLLSLAWLAECTSWESENNKSKTTHNLDLIY